MEGVKSDNIFNIYTFLKLLERQIKCHFRLAEMNTLPTTMIINNKHMRIL